METYWHAVGADKKYKEIIQILENDEPIAVFKGVSGSGKSWLLKALCVHWESSTGTAFYFEGKPTSYLSPYSIMHSGVDTYNPITSFRKLLPKALGMSIDTLFKTRGLFTETIPLISRSISGTVSKYCPAYDLESSSILESIDVKSNGKPILIIADGIQYWDAKSLALLNNIIDRTCHERKIVSVVVSYTIDQKSKFNETERIINCLINSIEKEIVMPSINTENYNSSLRALGLRPDLPNDVADSLYTICRSHLPSIRKGIDIINKSGKNINALEMEDIYRKLIEDKRISIDDDTFYSVLKYGALIGLNFFKGEIVCALGNEDSKALQGLSVARELGFLTMENNSYSFLHESYYTYFKEDAERANSYEMYEKLDHCFAILKPSEYLTRAIIAYKHSNHIRSMHLFVLQISEECRKYGKVEIGDIAFLYEKELIGKLVINEIKTHDLFDLSICILSFWKYFRQNDFDNCFRILNKMDTRGSLILEGEKNYFITSLYIATRNIEYRDAGRYIFNSLSYLKEHEPFIWIKISFNLLYSKSLEKDRDAAASIARELENYLISRIPFDKSSRDELYVLHRISPAYYPPNLASMRNNDAHEYFKTQYHKGDCKRIDEYFRSINNQAVTEIKKENWKQAEILLDEGIRLYSRSLVGRVANPEFIKSNSLLMKVISGKLSAQVAAIEYSKLIPEDIGKINLIVLANIISSQVLAGNNKEALNLLNSTRVHWELVNVEPFVYYLIKSSDALVQLSIGKHKKARKIWRKLNKTVKKIPYASSSIYIKRHKAIGKAISKTIKCNIIDDKFELKTMKVDFSDLPSFYQQVCFLSIIVYWRHS